MIIFHIQDYKVIMYSYASDTIETCRVYKITLTSLFMHKCDNVH